MNMLTKVLIGAAGVVAVGTVVAVVTRKEEQHNDVAEQAVKKDENGSILKRIQRFVKKKVIKFLAWVALHMEQIEAASAVIGLGSACFGIASAVRDFKRGNDLSNQITDMQEDIKLIRYYQDEDIKAINHNNKVFATSLEHICDATGVDAKELKDALDNCDPGFWDNNDLMNTLDAIKKDKKTA